MRNPDAKCENGVVALTPVHVSYQLKPIHHGDFLVEHAKFPFPLPDELRSYDTTKSGMPSTLSETMLL